jgi:hypothetical protein
MSAEMSLYADPDWPESRGTPPGNTLKQQGGVDTGYTTMIRQPLYHLKLRQKPGKNAKKARFPS